MDLDFLCHFGGPSRADSWLDPPPLAGSTIFPTSIKKSRAPGPWPLGLKKGGGQTKERAPGGPSAKRKVIAYVGGIDLTTGRYDDPTHTLFGSLQTTHKEDWYQNCIPELGQGPVPDLFLVFWAPNLSPGHPSPREPAPPQKLSSRGGRWCLPACYPRAPKTPHPQRWSN